MMLQRQIKIYFTLTELLVVISILAMLAALLIPSLKKSHQSAITLSCINTTRQTSVAWNLYVEDNEGKLFNYNTVSRKIWTAHFEPYSDDSQILLCPATTVPEIPVNNYVMGSATTAWVENRNGFRAPELWNRSSYCYNINLCPTNPYNSDSYKSLYDIGTPSSSPILGDGWWRAPARMNNNYTRFIPANLDDPIRGDRGQNSVDRFISNRHGQVTVINYVDGHSAAVYLDEVFAQQWYRSYDPNQPVQRF